MRVCDGWPILLLVAAIAALDSSAANAKKNAKKPGPPPPPPPLEAPQPLISWIYPAGGQRGKTVEIAATGANLVAPGDPAVNRVTVTGKGVTGIVLEAKEANKAKLAVTVAPDAETGERELRVITPGGISNRFRFIVGDLPEVNEVEPNSDKAKPQALPALPLVVNGQITDSDRDYFSFKAKAGQTLVCAVAARVLLPYIANAVPGWFDPNLTLYDSSGREVQYADDFRFKPDPVMVYKVPRDGAYTLELRDVIFRGRGDFIYRLTLGEQPYVTHIFPLGGERGRETEVEVYGYNLRQSKERVKIGPDAPARTTVAGQPFAVSDRPAVKEAEPNNKVAEAQRIVLPAVVDGRIEKPGDVDYYSFQPQSGQRLTFEIMARRLDSPLDSHISILNARGDVIVENDDWTDPLSALVTHHADSRLVWTAGSTGPFTLRVRDTQGNGGQEYAYRLMMGPARPDFALRISPDYVRLGQGDTTAIAVTAVRMDGMDSEIHLTVEGLPEGFVTSDAMIPAGQTEARVTITAPPDAPIGVLAPEVVGKAMVGSDTILRKAQATEMMQQAFAYQHHVPARQLLLAVVKPAAFRISASIAGAGGPDKVVEVKAASETPIKVKIHRQPSAKAGVACSAARAASGIQVRSAFLAADKDEVVLTLTVAPEVKPGLMQNIIISGVMKSGKETVVRYAPALPIRVVAAQSASAAK